MMIHQSKLKVAGIFRGISTAAFLLGTYSCGQLPSSQVQGQLTADDERGPEPYDSLDWYFPCPFDDATSPDRLVVPPQTDSRKLILNGVGPFNFIKEYMVRLPVKIHGRVCPWKLVDREVVFIVDVSGSMSGTDPEVDVKPIEGVKRENNAVAKTCGRMDALEAILAKMPAGKTKFAVATYDDRVVHFSTHLFNNKQDLYADLLRGEPATVKIKDVICRAGLGTSYKVGLDKAKAILLTGEAGSTKEMIFLSDGEPQDSKPTILATTADFKTNGVTIGGRKQSISIATLLLGTAVTSDILKSMASVDNSVSPPAPIFAKAANASDLADVLGRMIDNNKLQGSQVLHSGDTPGLPKSTVNVFPLLDRKNQFVTSSFILSVERSQLNYNMGFEYWDTMQNRSSFSGAIHWIPTLASESQ
jgi:von Willebrand factor type A domain